MSLPYELLAAGGKYCVEVRDGDVYVWGNKEGLLYLGDLIIRSAIGNLAEGVHTHIPLDSSEKSKVEPSAELLVFAADADLK